MTKKKNPIKILHVLAGGEVGGAENIFLEDVVALTDCDEIEQYVVTRPVDHRVGELQKHGVPVKTASFNKWIRFPTNKAIRSANDEFQPDIIQYWMGRAGTFAIPEKKGQHVNVAWYGGYYNRQKRFPECSQHIVLTKDLFKHVEETGANQDNIGLIHTLADFDHDATPIPRAQLDTPEDAVVILALARLHWKKGLDILIESVTDIPNAYVWIAGEGPLRGELETLAKRLKVEERIKFLGWRNDRERLLKSCDIVGFPSRYEPFGTVMVDAWAAKKPIVAAASQGPKAYMRDGKNGILIEVDDLEALRASFKNLINDPELVKTCIQGGWEDYQSTFTKEAFTQDSLAFYKKILSR